jgi:hypothetical protein
MNRFPKWLVTLALTALLTAACSSTFVYRQLDWLIPWYVEGMVDISGSQKDELRERLIPVLEWHREEELALYIAVFDQIEADLQQAVTARQARGWIEKAEEAIRRVELRLLEVGLELGAELDDSQMAEFRESLWEKHREYEEEYLPRSDREYRDETYEYLADATQSFMGRLTPGQQTVYRSATDGIIRFDATWLENRAAWLARIEPLLARPPGWQDSLRQAHRDRETNYSAEYHRVYEHNLGLVAQAMADVLNQRTEKQSQRLAEEFEDWRERLREMAVEP